MRSASDAAGWVRLARRVGAALNSDPEYLPLDATNGALVVTGAGAAPAATALKVTSGAADAPADAEVAARRLSVNTQHVQGLTDAQLRATRVPVDTGLTQTAPLTDTQLRATPVPVSHPGLTDAQLRATPVPVATGLTPLTDTQLRASAVPVSGPQTDAQARATPQPVDVSDRAARLLGHVMVDLAAETLLVIASAARTTSAASAALPVGDKTRTTMDLNVTAVSGVAPELRVFVDRWGADGVWYPIYSSPVITAVGSVSTTIGQGMIVGHSLGGSIRHRYEITGTSASFTFSASLEAK